MSKGDTDLNLLNCVWPVAENFSLFTKNITEMKSDIDRIIVNEVPKAVEPLSRSLSAIHSILENIQKKE